MLKKIRLVVLGGLLAGLLCFVCIGINTTPALAGSCCASKANAAPATPCDFTKELGLTPEQQAKIEKLKAECEKNGNKCTPDCVQKVKEILTKEQGEKLDVLIAKMKGGCGAGAPACKAEGAPQAK